MAISVAPQHGHTTTKVPHRKKNKTQRPQFLLYFSNRNLQKNGLTKKFLIQQVILSVSFMQNKTICYKHVAFSYTVAVVGG